VGSRSNILGKFMEKKKIAKKRPKRSKYITVSRRQISTGLTEKYGSTENNQVPYVCLEESRSVSHQPSLPGVLDRLQPREEPAQHKTNILGILFLCVSLDSGISVLDKFPY
jgi:hypothetical protein